MAINIINIAIGKLNTDRADTKKQFNFILLLLSNLPDITLDDDLPPLFTRDHILYPVADYLIAEQKPDVNRSLY